MIHSDPIFKNYNIDCITKKLKISQGKLAEMKKEKKFDNSFTLNQEAPGQFLKHYSPKLETYLYSGDDVNEYVQEIKINNKMVFVDYNNIMKKKFLWKNGVTNYNFLELSEEEDPNEAMKNFYNHLHEAEKLEGMECIIIIDLEKFMIENSHKLTLLDRMWKASSFKKAKLIL